MIGELEMEILEQRAIIVRTGANTLQKLESEHKQTLLELTNLKEKLDVVQADLSKSILKTLFFYIIFFIFI